MGLKFPKIKLPKIKGVTIGKILDSVSPVKVFDNLQSGITKSKSSPAFTPAPTSIQPVNSTQPLSNIQVTEGISDTFQKVKYWLMSETKGVKNYIIVLGAIVASAIIYNYRQPKRKRWF